MTKKILPRKYRDMTLIRKFDHAKKEYEKGNFIEAFVLLYSQLEFQLNMIWWEYLISHLLTKNEPKVKEYADLVELLFELEIIDQKSRDLFLGFKKGRNNVVHYMLKLETRSKVNKKLLDSQFNQGIKAYDVIKEVHEKLIMKIRSKLNNETKSPDEDLH